MITVSFPYGPQLVEKVKTIDGRKWHKDEKYWSFPDSDKIVDKILKVFEGEEIRVDPTLQAETSTSVIARHEVPKQSQKDYTVNPPLPPFRKGGQGGI